MVAPIYGMQRLMLLWQVLSLFISLLVRYNKNMAKQAKKAAKPSKVRQLWLNIGKLILDATKLCFGSLVLGTAIRWEFSAETLLLVGIIVSVGGSILGIGLVAAFEEK